MTELEKYLNDHIEQKAKELSEEETKELSEEETKDADHDRDQNAALNILRKGHLALAVGIPGL